MLCAVPGITQAMLPMLTNRMTASGRGALRHADASHKSTSLRSQVFRTFHIKVDADALLSRCSKCNGEFIDRCNGCCGCPRSTHCPLSCGGQHLASPCLHTRPRN